MAKATAKKQVKISIFDKAAKLTPAAKAAIIVATAVVVGGAFYALVLMPYQEESAALNGAIGRIKTEVHAQEVAVAKHQTVEKFIPAVESSYQYIQQYLPQENEMSRLVQMVAQIGSKAGLTDGVTLFAPILPAEVKENYAEIPFTMNLQGEFKAVLNFLYDFSRMNRIVNITQVNIAQPKMVDPQREILHISVKCAGSTYRSLTAAEINAPKVDPRGRRR